MNDDRAVAMETRLAYLEHTIQQLDEELAAHRRRMDALESASRELRQRLQAVADSLSSPDTGEDTPPHY